MSLSSYIRQLSKFVLSSSIVLGLVVGALILITGETTMEVDLTIELERLDSVWWIIGIPVVSILIFVILSPLSFLIHRLLSRKRALDVKSDA